MTDFHLDRRRIKLLSGGEGAGKSLAGAMDVIGDFPFWKLGYILGPKYEQCRKEFSYIAEALLLLGATDNGLISQPAHGQLVLKTFLEQRVVTLSAGDGENVVTGTGESPDWILMVEAGKLPYPIYLAARGRIARTRGKLILTGTIEEAERWYPELIARWRVDNPQQAKSFVVPSWENRIMYPRGADDPEIVSLRNEYAPDRFKERFGGEPSPPAALVLKDFSFETHVHAWVERLDGYPLQVWVDPGYSGSFYAVLFAQIVPRAVTRQFIKALPDAPREDVWIVDELYMQYAIHEEVIATAQLSPLWEFVRGGVGDVVMKTHPMAGEAPEQVWFKKAGVVLRGQRVDVLDGIDRHRTFLKDPAGAGAPRLFIHPQCKGLTSEYGRWKRKVLGENLFGDPEKTNCDALKALQYGLVDNFGFVDVAKKKLPPARKFPIAAAQLRGV